MCAERAVSAAVAGTAPAVGWSAGRGAPLEVAGVFGRSIWGVKRWGEAEAHNGSLWAASASGVAGSFL